MPESVLITGASGFIGRGLVKRLVRSGLKVRCLVRCGSNTAALNSPQIELIEGDLTDTGSVERAVAGVDTVWHLGALIRPQGLLVGRAKLAAEFHAVNASATENMARLSAAAGVKRFIYFSSIAASGPGKNIKEETEPRPLTLYGRSKLAGELALNRVASETRLNFIILRPAMIYGPGALRWESLFSLIRTRLIPVAGSGENTVSVCHLEALLDAAILAAEKGVPGTVFNIDDVPAPVLHPAGQGRPQIRREYPSRSIFRSFLKAGTLLSR